MHHAKATWTALVLVTVVLAGCVEDPADPQPKKDERPSRDYSDGRININDTDDSAKEWVPTLEEPPQLVRGQYWKVRVQLGLAGGTRDIDVVVAGQEDEFWLIGMPTHDFANDIMVLHIPGMGQVKKDTLGFEAHDVWFDALKFPLKKGDTWTTGFMAEGNLLAEVTKIDGLKATVEMRKPPSEDDIEVAGINVGGSGYRVVLEYDAEVRTITKFTVYTGSSVYGGYEVLEHGYDWHEAAPEWEGLVTVPHMSDLIFCHGDLAGLPMLRDCNLSNSPQDDVTEFEIDINPDYDRVSFANIIVSLVPGAPGYYEVTATAPDGTDYYDSLITVEGGDSKLTAYKHDMPGGTWKIEATAGGPGQAFMEGIGFHVYDVELPSGHILPSIGAHEHGSEQGH